MKTILVLGGTGAVGRRAVQMAQSDPRIARVMAPTRRPLAPAGKLDNPIVDFDALDGSEAFWQVDAVICALGTTQKIAGGRAGFRRIDRDLVLHLAGFARHAGVPAFAYVSSVGAAGTSPSFYLRTKGEVEAGLRGLGFPSLTVVRPSMIDAGRREQARPGEEWGAALMRLAAPVIPRRYRPVTPDMIAAGLIEAVLAASPGNRTIESEELAAVGQR